MLICLPRLIENLRENPNFLCNCRCEEVDGSEFIRSQIPTRAKLLTEILYEECLCFCTGCETIAHEGDVQDVDLICGRNPQNVQTLICLNTLIENLRNQPDFLCNFQCRRHAVDFTQLSLTEPSVKLVVNLLCEHPEYLCFCVGCEAHMIETFIPISDEAEECHCSRNSQRVETRTPFRWNAFIGNLRNQPILLSITGAIKKLRWILAVLTAIAMFFIFIKNNIETAESNGAQNLTTQSTISTTTTTSTTRQTPSTNEDGIWNPI